MGEVSKQCLKQIGIFRHALCREPGVFDTHRCIKHVSRRVLAGAVEQLSDRVRELEQRNELADTLAVEQAGRGEW